MVEAKNIKKQFKYWTPEDRSRKFNRVASVVDEYSFSLLSFAVSMSRLQFEKILLPTIAYDRFWIELPHTIYF